MSPSLIFLILPMDTQGFIPGKMHAVATGVTPGGEQVEEASSRVGGDLGHRVPL